MLACQSACLCVPQDEKQRTTSVTSRTLEEEFLSDSTAEVRVVKGQREYMINFKGTTFCPPVTPRTNTSPNLILTVLLTNTFHKYYFIYIFDYLIFWVVSWTSSWKHVAASCLLLCRHVPEEPQTQHQEESPPPSSLCLRGWGETDFNKETRNWSGPARSGWVMVSVTHLDFLKIDSDKSVTADLKEV